jgi:hypothetical protein
MANAFLPLARLAAVFRAHWSALAPRHALGYGAQGQHGPHGTEGATHRATHRALQASAGCPALRPLRVVRVLEPAAPRSTAGRMVISGRLADVCAELDRLAALEARGC